MLTAIFFGASINRAYYAIFYAAKALLATEDVSRVKHSGVISAFRRHFVKPGIISPEYSEIYGQVMEDRHESDYDLITAISREDAQTDMDQASGLFEVERWPGKETWL